MIEIIGQEGTAEFEAALSIRDALLKLWPAVDTESAERDLIKVVAGAKISGYRVSDIDVLICARFRSPRRFIPKKALTDTDGERVINRPVSVPSLVVAVEVKDHAASGVRFVGDDIEVKYSRAGPIKWKSATSQNIDQVHSLLAYFADQQIELYIHRLVLLRGLDRVSCNGALPRSFSGADLLTAIAVTSRLRKKGGEYTLSSGSSDMIERALSVPLLHRLVPSSLDRRRMDRIAVRSAAAREWQALMGTKMLRFRGRGGTGKTVMLLQMAWRAYELRGARTLVLTYNRALAADIRRLMALLGVPATVDTGGIAVETVMSFMLSWFSALQLLDEHDPRLLERYEEYCESTVEMIRTGAIFEADIEASKEANPDRFDFDYVVVDEAQDWPTGELETLKNLYNPKQLCLADGIDQLVRGQHANWNRGVPDQDRIVIPLHRCLRMKANLAVFANTVAERAGLNWRVEPNDEAAGGRVILVTGSYSDHWDLNNELLDAARSAGNAEIDFLFCVPPSDVTTDQGRRSSTLGKAMNEQGFDVWDATNEQERRDFPRGINTYRIVQYASCRGLEGWTVVADGLDKFWEHRRAEYVRLGLVPSDSVAYKSISELADEDAWRWCLIPLTRPIDTIVLCLNDPDSEFSRALLDVSERLPDVIERLGT